MTSAAPESTNAGLSVPVALMLLVVAVAALGGFIALANFLSLTPLYAAFLLLWYWAGIDKFDFKAAPATILGALAGVGTAWLLQIAVHSGSQAMMAGVLVLILVALFLQMVNWVPMLVNSAYMLFLTIACAPLLQAGEDYSRVMIAMLIGCAYFGGLIFIGQRIVSGRAKVSDAAAGAQPVA